MILSVLCALPCLVAHADIEKIQMPLKLSVGEEIATTIPSNPSTGYSWELASPLPADAPVAVEIKVLPPESEGLCGAPSDTQITVKGLKEGSYTLVLNYLRSWEKDTPPARTCRIVITVEAPKCE